MKHTIMCSCGKLAIQCVEASEAIERLIQLRLKELSEIPIKRTRRVKNMVEIHEAKIIESRVIAKSIKGITQSMSGSALQHEYIEKAINKILENLETGAE